MPILSAKRPGLVLISLALLYGCDSDELAPVSEYEGSECVRTGNCGEDKIKLDAGGGNPNGGDDAGGNNNGGADGGVDDRGNNNNGGTDGGDPNSGDSGVITPPPTVFLDLNGTWNTRYEFDLSAYLFGISGIADELDFIDQTFQGNIDTGFPPLDAFIVSIVQQFVPAWVQELVGVLNTAATLFETVYANGGRLTITQDPPANSQATETALHATETWTEIVILIVDNCPLGRSDPNFPACAEMHIPVTHNPQSVGPVEILVDVKPLEGSLNAGIPEADFRFRDREVDMEMRKLILLVLDTVVSITTPYPTLRDALGNVVDCSGLGDDARDFAENDLGLSVVVAIGIGALVEDQCEDILDDIVDGIANIGVDWEAMDFDQLGHAIDRTPQDSLRRPEILQSIQVQDTIDGRFRFAIQDPMGGQWEGLP